MERLLTLYSEVQSTDVRWLWYPFIAIGKITLLQGDPGDGKSTMMMNLIAELSTGGKTPDGCKIGAPQKVIYHQMNMFEDFIGYQGSAVLDEPVREEDSFSKESMSQESEISENILLPDLAKQSESIEQQSGEIAERGMPT